MKYIEIKKSIKETLTITKYFIVMFFREKTAIFFSLFIPIMLMGIFGLLNTGDGIKFNVGIVDQANNEYSRQAIETIEKVEVFKVTRESDIEESKVKLEDAKLSYVLVLPAGFGSNFSSAMAASQIQKAPTGSADVVPTPEKLVIYYDASQNTSTVQVGFTVFDKIFDGYTHQIARVPKLFEISQVSIAGANMRYIDFVVPGLVAMSVMQLSIFAVTGQIVSWRERGILKRLLATPINPGVIIFSQIISRVIITFLQAATLILMGMLLFQLQIVGSIALVVALIVLGGLIFLSMGFALSGIATTQNVVAALANLFVFPQMLLSGIFFPREVLPDWVNRITSFFPLTYFADALRQVMVKGADVAAIRTDIIGMSVWAIIMFILAVKMFRWE